jgi:ribosomal protein L5
MPEIKYDNVNQSFGFQVNIYTNTKDVKISEILLKNLGFPFEKS